MAEQFGSNPWPQSSSTVEQPTRATTRVPAPTGMAAHGEKPAYTEAFTARDADPFRLADTTTQPLRPLRTWPALLTLYLLAPITGEVLSGSTPPLQFINPFTLLALAGLYGSGAIVARELVRRRGLGWPGLLLFGAAYGILEEGLVVTSWFNPKWPDLNFLAYYGRLFDTSWVWATHLTIYHAVVSIMVPVLLAEILFPRIANRPWLGKRGFTAFAIWLAFVSLLEAFFFILTAIHSKGYPHPPLMYLGALLLAVGLVLWGLHLRSKPRPSSAGTSPHPAPRLWWLRLAGFGSMVAIFISAWLLPRLIPLPIVPIASMLSILALGIWLMSHWTKRTNWGTPHRLAFISGVLGFFIALSPLIEFVVHPAHRNPTGMTLFTLAFLVGLIFLAWRVRRNSSHLTPVPGKVR